MIRSASGPFSRRGLPRTKCGSRAPVRERARLEWFVLAERAGFEPAIRDKPYTHFPGVLLQPLGHLSTLFGLAPARSLCCAVPISTCGARRILGAVVALKRWAGLLYPSRASHLRAAHFRGRPAAVQNRQAFLSNPRYGDKPNTLFPGALSTARTPRRNDRLRACCVFQALSALTCGARRIPGEPISDKRTR